MFKKCRYLMILDQMVILRQISDHIWDNMVHIYVYIHIYIHIYIYIHDNIYFVT